MERSLAFTALLNQSLTFGKLDLRESGEVITIFLRDYNAQPPTAILPDMYSYAKTWLANHNDLVCPECGSWLGKQHAGECSSVRKSYTDRWVLLEACEGA